MTRALVSDPDDDPAPPPPALAPPIDRFDLEIVEFMLSWAPYGGPPRDECVPLFGMSRDRLLARFHRIVSAGERRHLGSAELAMLDRAAELMDVSTTVEDSLPTGRWVLRQGVWRWSERPVDN